ncbi:MAG TPA: hypothetical protein VK842_02890 [bacterium]|nr:hypothetical protein [bacterium]
MQCPQCEGRGFVPADMDLPLNSAWDGAERRKQGRMADNGTLRFSEVIPAGVYQSCPRCEGAGKVFDTLLSAQH